MTRGELLDFLRRRRLAVVSTASSNGKPESAVVGIAVSEDLEIVFDTVRTSRKYRNLAVNPSVAVATWTGEKTAQYEGIASELGEADARYRDLYLEIFPDGRDRLSWPGITHFVIRPAWIRYSDFAARPPVIEEFTFEGN
ncbi:MAG TPA: pyridoxamine 5'-phosphate oxidase family protein [Bryobacteraceae bacterium]|jgi:uncharacterized pyridoxamine 5'-phosphate oxidase family protein|nr:pyridoxamine 5'-phosphate oxidase family protein [Bryobacteraceae bacterium]